MDAGSRPDRTGIDARMPEAGAPERWVLAGTAAVLIAAAAYRRGWIGTGLAAAGGALAACAAGGHSIAARGAQLAAAGPGWIGGLGAAASGPVRVEQSITILKPRTEVYNFWRDLRNLPRFMEAVERVDVRDTSRSHWVAKGPGGARVEWDAEITRDEPPESISWQSAGTPDIPNSGTVRFAEAPGRRGTELHVVLTYEAPGGRAGRLLAGLFGRAPEQQLRDSLRRLRQILEAGEIPTIEGQPSGRGRDRAEAA